MRPTCSTHRAPTILPLAPLAFLYPALLRVASLGRSTKAASGMRPFHAATARRSSSSSSSSTDPPPSSSSTDTYSRLNPSPDDYKETSFADKAKLTLYAGGGGSGCISFFRDAHIADGPANGGDGGHGGSVYIQAVHGETSLHKIARKRFIRAGFGKSGQGSSRGGQRGLDVILTVPVGTVLTEIGRDDPELNESIMRRERRRRLRELRQRLDAEADRPPASHPELEGEVDDEWPGEGEGEDRIRETPEQRAAREEEEDLLENDPDSDKFVLYPGLTRSDGRKIELPRIPSRGRLLAPPHAPVHLDLSRPTPRPILLCPGGLGGLGNPHFVNKQRPKPMIATRGQRAMWMEVSLELKLLADVGLVGLPNAGKSTLLRAISNSRARIGNWAFTTLQPNIGTVVLDNNRGRPTVTSYRRKPLASSMDPYATSPDAETQLQRRTRFTVADIPGLIEGAHLDKGLGIEFLRHVERAGVLAFVVDLGAGDAVAALKALWNEVGLYAQMCEDEERQRRQPPINWANDEEHGHGDHGDGEWWPGASALQHEDPMPPEQLTGLHIAAKPWFVVATKGDLPSAQANFQTLRSYLTAISHDKEPHPSGVAGSWTKDVAAIPISAINGHGVDRLIHWTVGLLDG